LHKDSYQWAKNAHKKEQEKKHQSYKNQQQKLEDQYLENLDFWNDLPPTEQISSPKPKRPETTKWKTEKFMEYDKNECDKKVKSIKDGNYLHGWGVVFLV